LYDAREHLGYSGEPLEGLEGAWRGALIVDPEGSTINDRLTLVSSQRGPSYTYPVDAGASPATGKRLTE